jgi:hypothetical protein
MEKHFLYPLALAYPCLPLPAPACPFPGVYVLVELKLEVSKLGSELNHQLTEFSVNLSAPLDLCLS